MPHRLVLPFQVARHSLTRPVGASVPFLLLQLASVLITYVDFVTGPYREVGLFYNLIVILACLKFGFPGLIFVPVVLGGYLLNMLSHVGSPGFVFYPSNVLLRAMSFTTIGLVSSVLHRALRAAQQRQWELESSISEREAVFRCLPDAILTLDLDLKVVGLGGRTLELLGLAPERALGRGLGELEVEPAIAGYLERFQRSPEEASEGPFQLASGRHLTVGAAPIQTDRGSSRGWVLTLRDATELVRLQELRVARTRTLAVLETRTRLARHLHDNVAQTLAAIRMRLDLLGEGGGGEERGLVRSLQKGLGVAIRDLRQTMEELRPSSLERFPFEEALRVQLGELQESSGFRVDLRLQGAVRLAPDREVLLFYVIQELVSNALKHSQAAGVLVELDGRRWPLHVLVEDRGVGFDPRQVESTGRRRGYGLRDLQDRARALGAELVLEASPGSGTRVRLSIPEAAAEPREV